MISDTVKRAKETNQKANTKPLKAGNVMTVGENEMTGNAPMYEPEAVKFEWTSFDEAKILQDAQKKLEDQLKIEELEKELKTAWQKIKKYQQIIVILQETGAVSQSVVRKAHELLNEVTKGE